MVKEKFVRTGIVKWTGDFTSTLVVIYKTTLAHD